MNKVGDTGTCNYKGQSFGWKIVSGGGGIMNVAMDPNVWEAFMAMRANTSLLEDIAEDDDVNQLIKKVVDSCKG